MPAAGERGWRVRKLARRLRRAACSRLYRDGLGSRLHTVMLAGTARSGTTWLAEALASQQPCRVMFEPFNPRKVKAYARYHYFQYMRPEASDEVLRAYCQSLFAGAVRHPWIDREMAVLRPRFRLVKDIRANLMLAWIHREFPEVPMLLVLRHPCAVVASRLRLGWATDTDIASFRQQPALIADHLEGRMKLVDLAQSDEEKHAVIWCISNLVPLAQFGSGGLATLHYEALCTRPLEELGRVATELGLPRPAPNDEFLRSPSMTTRPGSAIVAGHDRVSSWTRILSARQVRKVLDVVDGFGLSHLYGESTMPRAGAGA
jgi:hypothetical protein